MRDLKKMRWMLRAGVTAGLGVLVAAPAGAVALLSWSTDARISSGNSTLVSAPSPSAPIPPDATTGFLEANGASLSPPGPLDAGTIASFGLSSGVLASGGAWAGSANAPVDNRLFDLFGGGAATYFDDLTITSGSLANGTPVDVRFVFDLAFSAVASITAGNVNESNFASAAADVQAVAAGVVGIDQNTNRFFENLDTGTFIQTGIFTGAQHAEFTISTTVGSVVPFALVVDADALGSLHPNSGGVNGAGHAASFLAISFGAEVVGADAAVASALLGGAFPSAALVSPAAAQNALPANPLAVPEPALFLLLATAVISTRMFPCCLVAARRGCVNSGREVPVPTAATAACSAAPRVLN